MSKLYNGGAGFGFSLNFNTAVPVDTRFVVQSVTDLKNPQTWVSGNYDPNTDANNVYVVYPGLHVIVLDEKTIYVFGASKVSGTTIGSDSSWTRLATGENTGDIEAAIKKAIASVGLSPAGNHVGTSGNYTSSATTVVGEIAALDTALKNVDTRLGTTSDDSSKNTAFGKIAAEKLARENAINALDSDYNKSDTGGFVNLKVTQTDGKITKVEVATNDITPKTSLTGSSTIGLSGNVFEVKASIKYVAAVDGTPAHIALVDKNGTELSTVKVSDIIGNGLLASHSYDTTSGKLTLTFNKADGTTQDTEIDLGAMLDIDDVLIHADSSKYLSVDLTGAENSQAVFKALIIKMANATTSVTGLADAYDVKKYVDDKASNLTVKAEGDDYVGAEVSSIDNKKIIVSTNTGNLTVGKTGTAATTITGTANTLVDGSELATKVGSFVEARLSEKVGELDSTKTSTDGSHVTVKVTQTDGKISGVGVTESDIASAALLGAKTDDKTKDTAFGKIAKEASDRIAAIQALDLAASSSNAVAKDSKSFVKTTISETDGIVKNEGVSVTYGTFAGSDGIATVGEVKSNVRFEKGTGTNSAILKGTGTNASNEGEVALGKYNNSVTHASSTASKTIFSVGNGTSASDLHNAVEIRENGDIWINLGTDYKKLQTILSNEIDWYEGQ